MDAGAALELGPEHRRWHPCGGAVAAGKPAPPEQGYRACLGLLNLSKTYGEERLEAACRRALTIGAPHRKRIIEILKAKLDQHPELFPAADTAAATASRTHGNVRGADYFRDSLTTSTETTTTDEGDDDSCLSNPRSIH